ncbi:MAG: cytochrome c-550 PedF [Thiolinea sp.]
MEINKSLTLGLSALLLTATTQAFAHGDVTPQAVDTTGLDSLGEEWLVENPYRGNEKAIEIGASAYNSNCARCHGLEAVSGGIAPDLRELHNVDDDEYFIGKIRNGVNRNGVTYMPGFEEVLNQEAMWSIRAWLVSVSLQTLKEKEAAAAESGDAGAAEEKPAATDEATDKPAETTSQNATEADVVAKKKLM